jgi:hypothetical protein
MDNISNKELTEKIMYVLDFVILYSADDKKNNAYFSVEEMIEDACNDENPDAPVKTNEFREIIDALFKYGILTKCVNRKNGNVTYQISFNVSKHP